MLTILSFSTNPEILPVMDRLVNKHPEWTGLRAADLPAATSLLTTEPVDLVLLGAGTGRPERNELAAVARKAGKHVRFVDHYGGGSGLLLAEVRQALATRF